MIGNHLKTYHIFNINKMKKDIIYITIILALILTGYFFYNNYNEEITTIKKDRARLEADVKELNWYVSVNEKEINLLLGNIEKGLTKIDSLKNIEHEIPNHDITNVPVGQRNGTIERLAAQ